MANQPLTRKNATELFELHIVQDYLTTNHPPVQLEFNDETNQIVIRVTSSMEGGALQDHLHAILDRLIRGARNAGIALTAKDFQIIKFRDEGTAGGQSTAPSRAVKFQPVQAPTAPEISKSTERPITPAVGGFARRLTATLESHGSYLVGELRQRLNPDPRPVYTVSLGTVEGKTVINIAHLGIIEQVLDRFGIMTPIEEDPKVATAISDAFTETLGKRPEQGEIVINDHREADVAALLEAATIKTRRFGAPRGPGLGM